MAEEYKISLGVDVNTNDIRTQINRSIGNSQFKKIKLELNTKRIDSQLNSVRKQIQNLSKIKVNLNINTSTGIGSGSANGAANSVNKTANELITAYNKLKNISKNIGSIKIKLSDGLDTSKDVQQIKVLESQLQSLTSEYHKTVSKIKGKGDLSSAQWQSIQQQIDNTKIKLDQLEAEMADARSKLSQKIQLRLETGDFTNQVKKIESDSNKLSGTYNKVKTGIDQVKLSLDAMKTASAKGDIEGLISANERYERALKDVQNQLQINARAERDTASALRLDDSRNAFMSNIDAWLTKNSAAVNKFGTQMLKLKAQAKSCDQVTLNHLKNEFKRLDKEAEAAGLKMQSFGDRLKTQFSKYSSYLSIASVFMYASQGLRDMFNQVVAIDSAMTELKKVTDETDASYNKFLNDAASKSKELGTTIDGLVGSTADFARLGYGFEESQGLAEVANIYAVVGDEIEGVEGATKSLISTLAAFKDEASGISDADFAMDIVDKFNEVSNNFAISSGGIGEAMQRSASSLRAANNTIDESIALITAANTVVQDPVTIGTAFKTISMRIRGAKTELEEAGLETDGMVESTAKLRQEILALSGVDIMKNANEFKSTYAIMDELAQKWEDLTDIQQASVTELIAGKRQGNVVSSLMQNFDIARDALETSLNSSGSAMAEHAKWSESLEARLNKLKSTWQSLSQSFLSSDFLKVGLDGIIGLVNGVDKLIDTFGTLPTLLTGFTMFRSAFSNKGIFKTFNNDLDGFANKVGIANKSFSELISAFNSANTGGFKGIINGLKSMGDALVNPLSKVDLSAIDAYNKLIDNGIDGQEAFARTMGNTSNAAQDLVKSANGGKIAINGIKTASVGGKVALLGMRAAALLMNAALTMGISLLIDFAVSGIMKLINAEEDLAESVDEVVSKFKEQHEELRKLKGDYDTSNESSMINKYAKLSKGVDSLGRNVSLTSEEYSEYQSIVNNIADQIPSLVAGYDSQGNALLSCKGNVEELAEAYEKLIHAQNTEILSKNAKDIEDNFKNVMSQASGYDFWERAGNFFSFDGFFGGATDDFDMKENTAKWLGSLTSDTSEDDIKNYLNKSWYNTDRAVQVREIKQALQDAGYDINTWSSNSKVSKVLKEALENEPEKIQNILDDYYGSFDEAIETYKTKAIALLSEAFDVSSAISGLDYGNISEDLQAIAYQTVNSLDFDFLSKLTESGKTIDQWTKEMLNQLNAISKKDNAQIEAAFDLQTQFNGGEISYGEYVKSLKDVQTTIDGLNLKGEAKEQLEISLGLDDDGVIDQYNALVKRLTDPKNYDFNITEGEAKKLLDGLSSEELAVAVDVITEMSNNDVSETADEIRTAIERELTIQGLSLDLTVEKAKINFEALSTAITESFSGSGLSEESISAVEGIFGSLKSYDSSKLFERTANGIRLNSEEYRKLNSEYKKTNVASINKEMDSLGDIYNQTREELYRLTYGTDEYNDKARDLSAIEQQIKDLEKLAAGYEGVASAYQEWQMMESAGSQRDMYENVISGLENIDDEISRGWYDDATIEFLELLTGKDLSTAGIDKVKEAYKGLKTTIEHTSYSVRDFFTVDEDGNSTNTGVYNFLDAIGQLEEEAFGGKDVVQRKDGRIIGFNFDLVGGDEVIAEALGVSEELVQIMVRAADDAGFVVSMDGTYQQLDVLREKAQEASVSLNNILEKNGEKGFDFNFNSSNVDDIKKQLTEAQRILDTFRNTDGTINTELKGADEALTVASTLQSMLDKLTRPTYMDIEVSQVEDEIQEPLKNLQELRRLLETEHQLKLSGADTSKLEESKQEVYEYFENLDPEIKAEIGLVDKDKKPLTGQALKDKLNSGDIAIEATVDIQLEMDEKLGILVDKALLDAGIIDNEEFKKRVNIYLDADVDNEDAKTKTEQAVSEVTGSKNSGTSKDNKATSDKVEKNVDVEIKADEVKTEGFWGKVKSWWNNLLSKDETETAKVETDVDVEAGEINTSNIQEEVGEAIEKVTELEVKADEVAGLVRDLESKDITIDVKVKGLDDVKELNKNIDLATKIKGSVNKLSEYVEGAKALSELDDNITSYVTAEVKGNVLEKSKKELKRLGEFAEHAKTLQDTNSKQVDITANVDGNVISTKERKIDNLKTFIDSAKGIKDVEGDIISNITANTLGSVFEDKERKIDNLDVFIESAKGIKDIEGDIISNITANTLGSVFEDKERKIDNLDVFIESAKGIKDIEGNIISNITANTLGSVFEDKERNIDNLKTFINSANGIKDIEGNIVSNITANTLGSVFEDKERNIDNIKTFIESAKGIKDIEGNIVSNITANTLGNVFENKERKTDNLNVFIDSAKGIKDIEGNIISNITANTLGSVFEDKERTIDNLDVFVESAKGIKDIEGNIVSNITANVNGNVVGEKTEGKINNLEVFAEGAKELQGIESKTVNVTANIYGNVPDKTEGYLDDLQVFAKGAKDLQNVASKTVNVTANIYGNVPTYSEDYLDDLQVFADGANALQNTASKTVNITANANGNVISGEGSSTRLSSLTEFKSLVEGMSNQTVAVSVTANVDSANINQAIDLLTKVSNSGVFKDYNATVKVGATIATIDDAKVQNYKAPSKKGKVSYSVDENSSVYTWTAPSKNGTVNYSAEVEALTNAQKHKTGTITYKAKISGFPVVNGTANASGSAFADGTSGKAYRQGDWGVKKTTTALTGELGQELVVYGNRFWTVGDNGAEFATIPKGAIVFNHKQTEELFANGKVTSGGGRGKVFANGTAYAEGTAYSSGEGGSGKVTVSVNSNTGTSYTKSTDNDDFEETIDLIEIAISRLERDIDNLDQKANNIYKSWSSRNSALASEISKVGDEIELQQKAYNEYMKAAAGVGLPSSWVKKVQNGEVDIETIKDEALADKISDYQKYYETALDCKDAIEELKEEEASLYVQRLENVASQYEGILSVVEHEKNMLEEHISQSEAQGWLVSAKYYDALAANERENIAQLKKQKAAMLSELQKAMESGDIAKGSEAWYEMVSAVDDVTLAIEESNTALLEYNQTLQQLSWEQFDLLQEKISAVTEEADFLIELMSNDKLYDDKGQLTDEGKATVGLHGQNYNTYMYQADQAAKEAEKLKAQLAKDPYDTELEERYREMISLQQEYILAAQDEKEAIKDLVEEGIDKELDSLSELIDKKKEALQSEKD